MSAVKPFSTVTYRKWILSGEHSVLRGQEAIVLPLFSKKLQFNYTPNFDSLSGVSTKRDLQIKTQGCNAEDIESIVRALLSKALTHISQEVPAFYGTIEIFNEIPLGSGLGASSSLCVAFGRWFEFMSCLPAENDYSVTITELLRLDASKARHRRLENLLGRKLAFQPRRRGDIQFIFAPSTSPQAARLLRPQLRFHYAGDLPTYSTSDAYAPDASANRDLDGLIFPDMPWVFDVGPRSTQVHDALRAAWGEEGTDRGKLFAFGYDALQLAVALPSGGAASIDGLTGKLHFDDNRRVRRELVWAQIADGQARLLPEGASAPAGPWPLLVGGLEAADEGQGLRVGEVRGPGLGKDRVLRHRVRAVDEL